MARNDKKGGREYRNHYFPLYGHQKCAYCGRSFYQAVKGMCDGKRPEDNKDPEEGEAVPAGVGPGPKRPTGGMGARANVPNV